MDIVSNTLELTPRVRDGLDAIQQGRFQERDLWNVPLSVLDEETRKLPLVKRKALAVSNVLTEMPIRIETYELIVGFSVHNSVAHDATAVARSHARRAISLRPAREKARST